MIRLLLALAIAIVACGCRPVPAPPALYDPAALRCDGARVLAREADFVGRFPYRASGQPNNARAARWLRERLAASAGPTVVDSWQVVNYSRPVTLRNVVCRIPGRSPREILIAAHYDQSPRTIEGADNDGSGIALLMELAAIFGQESRRQALPWSLVLVATDGEEYGMLGARRYVRTHPDPGSVVAGISLDNLGKTFYSGIDMEITGQFHGVGALWLQLLAGEAVAAAGDPWAPRPRVPIEQVMAQAVPISFMDQGPMVAAGIPALGFSGTVPPEAREAHWSSYHSPTDRVGLQSAVTLDRSGRAVEALVRALMAREETPRESGPYVYFPARGEVLRGVPLWSVFAAVVAPFFLAGAVAIRRGGLRWDGALAHFLALWLPLVGGLLLLYGLVAVGALDRYELYPATTRDPALVSPRWPAVAALALGIFALRWVARRVPARPVDPGAVRALAFLTVGLAALYVLAVNPFSLVFFVPLLFWLPIRATGRRRDLPLFALGGLVVYGLVFYFGFVVQRIGFYVLWYLLMMFSIREVDPATAVMILSVLAAGLSLVVAPGKGHDSTT